MGRLITPVRLSLVGSSHQSQRDEPLGWGYPIDLPPSGRVLLAGVTYEGPGRFPGLPRAHRQVARKSSLQNLLDSCSSHSRTHVFLWPSRDCRVPIKQRRLAGVQFSTFIPVFRIIRSSMKTRINLILMNFMYSIVNAHFFHSQPNTVLWTIKQS